MAEPTTPPAAQPKAELSSGNAGAATPGGQTASGAPGQNTGGSEGVGHVGQPSRTAEVDQPNPLSGLLTFFLPIMILMYLFMIRPENKRRKEKEALLGAMKVNDEVVTIFGLYGTIIKIDDDDVLLVVDPKKDVKMRFRKSAIDSVVSGTEKK